MIDLSIDPSKTTKDIVSFIKRTVQQTGFSRLVIGLSGGLDSAVSLALAVKALGAVNIYVGLFPYRDLDSEGLHDAKLLINHFKIASSHINLIDIKPFVDPIAALDKSINRLRKGNITVRLRMILLFDLAKKYQALVLGTENKTEYLLGYFTRFGDSASDIEPLRGFYKTQVKQLALYLKIPEGIIKKPPTAGLWLGQTDEKELGFTYEEADEILHLYVDRKKNKEGIINYGFKKKVVETVIKRLKSNEFKHNLPYLI